MLGCLQVRSSSSSSSAATIASGRLRRFSAKLIAATLSTAKRANRCRAIDLISGTLAPSTRSLFPSRLPLHVSATSAPHPLQRPYKAAS